METQIEKLTQAIIRIDSALEDLRDLRNELILQNKIKSISDAQNSVFEESVMGGK